MAPQTPRLDAPTRRCAASVTGRPLASSAVVIACKRLFTVLNHSWKRKFDRQLLIRKIFPPQAPQIELRSPSTGVQRRPPAVRRRRPAKDARSRDSRLGAASRSRSRLNCLAASSRLRTGPSSIPVALSNALDSPPWVNRCHWQREALLEIVSPRSIPITRPSRSSVQCTRLAPVSADHAGASSI